MKMPLFNLKTVVPILSLGLALLAGGCGNSTQQKAYEQAATAEQHLTAENSAAVVAEYQRVIALQPDSEWARKAQMRIDAVEARAKAEEQRKNVFQEHGVD